MALLAWRLEPFPPARRRRRLLGPPAGHVAALLCVEAADHGASLVCIALDLPNRVLGSGVPGQLQDAGYHRDPSAAMASPTPSGTLSSWPTGSAAQAGELDEVAALAAYQAQRDEALAPILDVTWQLAQFPPVGSVPELQKRLMGLVSRTKPPGWRPARPLATADDAGPRRL